MILDSDVVCDLMNLVACFGIWICDCAICFFFGFGLCLCFLFLLGSGFGTGSLCLVIWIVRLPACGRVIRFWIDMIDFVAMRVFCSVFYRDCLVFCGCYLFIFGLWCVVFVLFV